MRARKDLELVEPLIRLKRTLADLDTLSAEDEERGLRISEALCLLQHAIDLLDEAQVSDS